MPRSSSSFPSSALLVAVAIAACTAGCGLPLRPLPAGWPTAFDQAWRPGAVAPAPAPLTPADPAAPADPPSTGHGGATVSSLVVYLDGWGGHLVAGPRDDARVDQSYLLTEAGLSQLDVPAFEGTAVEWLAMEACVARAYAGLPITLVRRRPSEGHYVRIMIGGRAATMGPTNRWGVAPTGAGVVVEHGIGFVFSADHQTPTRTLDLCQSVAHELGHMIGLPHTPDCRDLMSDDRSCPHEVFGEVSRARLEASLRAWGEVAALSLPARLTGVVGDDPAMTGLRLWSRGLEPMPGGATALAPALLAFTVQAPRPIAHARLRVVTPDQLRGEYHCSVGNTTCDVVGDQVIGRYPVTGAGEFHLLAEVTYPDGVTHTTPWIRVVKP